MQKYFLLLYISAIVAFSFSIPIQNVAIKQTPSGHRDYLYTIRNGTEREINFFVSTDSVEWEQITLENNFQKKLKYSQASMFFKLYSSHKKFVCYRLTESTIYKIYYDPATDRYDLLRY